MKKIGLTGGIGSGKSAVKKILWQLNYPCFDADSFTREILASPKAAEELCQLFSEAILGGDGLVDRGSLRQLVFADSSRRKTLESYMHPRIQAKWLEILRRFEACPHDVWVFYEAALLIETGRKCDFDKLVLVTAPLEVRLERLAARGLDTQAAQGVISSQWTDAEKLNAADYVIQNNSTIETLRQEVFQMLLWLGGEFSVSGN